MTIQPSKRPRISNKSERSSTTTTTEASSRSLRSMEREKRRRQAESENPHTVDDDAEENEEIPHIVSEPEMDQAEDEPLLEPDLRTNPETIIRKHIHGTPAEVVILRQATSSSKPSSNGNVSSQRSEVTQTEKASKVSRQNRRDSDKSNEEAKAGIEEDEQGEEDEGQDKDSGVEMNASSTIRSHEPDRLWGHQAALNKIFSDAEKYRKARKKFYENQYRGHNELPMIKEICDLCDTIVLDYENLQATSSYIGLSDVDEKQVEQCLPNILNLVEELDPDAEDENEDSDTTAATQVYLYVFPALIHLLEAAVKYHCSIIAPDGPNAMLDASRLNSLGEIFGIIETLDQHSKDWKAKPEMSGKLHFVRDMRIKVIVKLRKIANDLRKHAMTLSQMAADFRKRRLEALAARQQQELERQQEAERLVMKEKTTRLCTLYFERLKIEPDIYRQSKLRTPKFGARRPELDANGEPFERVSMFQERNGSHIPHQWEDGEQEWQDCENEAIIDGLKTYYGTCIESLTSWHHSLDRTILTRDTGRKNFWIRIFQRNCGRNGPLRDRKVHEILRQAKLMRSIWIQADREHGWLTEDYILNIPDLDLLELL